MAMVNMNLIGVFVTKLWHVQELACDGGGGDGGATKNIISPKSSNFGDIIIKCSGRMALTRTISHGRLCQGGNYPPPPLHYKYIERTLYDTQLLACRNVRLLGRIRLCKKSDYSTSPYCGCMTLCIDSGGGGGGC